MFSEKTLWVKALTIQTGRVDDRFPAATLEKVMRVPLNIWKPWCLVDIDRRVIRVYWPATVTENAVSRFNKTFSLKRMQQSNKGRHIYST